MMHLNNVTACGGTVSIIGQKPEWKFRMHVVWADARQAQQPPADRPVRETIGLHRNSLWDLQRAALAKKTLNLPRRQVPAMNRPALSSSLRTAGAGVRLRKGDAR